MTAAFARLPPPPTVAIAIGLPDDERQAFAPCWLSCQPNTKPNIRGGSGHEHHLATSQPSSSHPKPDQKNPRKGRSGITKIDLLVINKTDLAPCAGACLAVMEPDTLRMRSTAKGLLTQASKLIFSRPRRRPLPCG